MTSSIAVAAALPKIQSLVLDGRAGTAVAVVERRVGRRMICVCSPEAGRDVTITGLSAMSIRLARSRYRCRRDESASRMGGRLVWPLWTCVISDVRETVGIPAVAAVAAPPCCRPSESMLEGYETVGEDDVSDSMNLGNIRPTCLSSGGDIFRPCAASFSRVV
ncbi:MAG TPA: hypothetical protein VGP07_24810 [Polyangia bacterium]